MQGEQRILRFRKGGGLDIDVRVFETGPNDRMTIGSIVPLNNLAGGANLAAWRATYFPFSVGKEYTKTQMVDHATTYGYTLTMTSAENAAEQSWV